MARAPSRSSQLRSPCSETGPLDTLRQRLEDLVGLAQRHRELSLEMSSATLADTLLALMLGLLLQEQIRGGDPEAAEIQLEACLGHLLLPLRRPR